jgi:hypothetical protein
MAPYTPNISRLAQQLQSTGIFHHKSGNLFSYINTNLVDVEQIPKWIRFVADKNWLVSVWLDVIIVILESGLKIVYLYMNAVRIRECCQVCIKKII